MSQKSVNTRELIVQILLEISQKKEYSSLVLNRFFQKYDYLESSEKAFIKRTVEGSLERRITLDYQIDSISRIPVRKMRPFIRELLRMSAYQMIYMSGVPVSAVINEAVKLAKKKGFRELSGFVNGVLRNLAREGSNLKFPDRKENETAYLSVCYSMPVWIIEKFQRDYGKKITEKILEDCLQIKPVTIRFIKNVTKEKRDKIISAMKERGVKVEQHPYVEEAYFLYNVSGVSSLPGFEEGIFTVQDASSMLAVEAAGIKPGDTVVDVCAAPGGKAMYASMLAGAEGTVYAFDVSDCKIERIKENCERLKLSRIKAEVRDSRNFPSKDEALKADVVIADVPCLGLGVMGHKRDIKYRVQKEDLKSLNVLQKEIVTASVQWLKPGGIFLYSTCSMTKEENQDMVRYMQSELNLIPENMERFLPGNFLKSLDSRETEMVRKGYFQLIPGKHKTDGFFFARMRQSQECER